MMDITKSVRPIIFQTDCVDFQYATYGGTLFVVRFCGHCYGLTCAHVFKDFDRDQLFISREASPKKGSSPAQVRGYFVIPGNEELSDVTAFLFENGNDPDLFYGTEFQLNEATIGKNEIGQSLVVYGFLKDKTNIDYDGQNIRTGFATIECHQSPSESSDYFLRKAQSIDFSRSFDTITGISGAPVFDGQRRLCGMVVRGGITGPQMMVWYIDVLHIMKILEAAQNGSGHYSYEFFP